MSKLSNTNLKKPSRGFGGRVWKFVRNAFLTFLIVSVAWVIIDRFVPVFITPLMVMRSVEAVFKGEMSSIETHFLLFVGISPLKTASTERITIRGVINTGTNRSIITQLTLTIRNVRKILRNIFNSLPPNPLKGDFELVFFSFTVNFQL